MERRCCAERVPLPDGMISGGLLITVPPSSPELIAGAKLGEFVDGPSGTISIE